MQEMWFLRKLLRIPWDKQGEQQQKKKEIYLYLESERQNINFWNLMRKEDFENLTHKEYVEIKKGIGHNDHVYVNESL